MTTKAFEVCTSKVLYFKAMGGMGRWWWWVVVVDAVVVGCRSCDGSFYIRDDDDDEKRGSRRRETRVLYLPVLEGEEKEKVTTSTATTLTLSRDSIPPKRSVVVVYIEKPNTSPMQKESLHPLSLPCGSVCLSPHA